MKYMFTGSAPISPEILIKMRLLLCCEIQQAYGLSETCAPCSMQHFEDKNGDSVGIPLPTCEIKLIDIPEMNYFTSNAERPQGEICI